MKIKSGYQQIHFSFFIAFPEEEVKPPADDPSHIPPTPTPVASPKKGEPGGVLVSIYLLSKLSRIVPALEALILIRKFYFECTLTATGQIQIEMQKQVNNQY